MLALICCYSNSAGSYVQGTQKALEVFFCLQMVNVPLTYHKKAKGIIYSVQGVKHNFSPNPLMVECMQLSTKFSGGMLVPFASRRPSTSSRQEKPGELMKMKL